MANKRQSTISLMAQNVFMIILKTQLLRVPLRSQRHCGFGRGLSLLNWVWLATHGEEEREKTGLKLSQQWTGWLLPFSESQARVCLTRQPGPPTPRRGCVLRSWVARNQAKESLSFPLCDLCFLRCKGKTCAPELIMEREAP